MRNINKQKALLFVLSLFFGLMTNFIYAETTDNCDDKKNFFIFPGEKSDAAIISKNGKIEISKAKGGDAFTRWSNPARAKMPLNDNNRWLAISFDKFTKPGTAAVVYAVFFKGKKRLKHVEIGKIQGGDELLVADLKETAAQAAPEADGFWLFFRHGNDPNGSIKIDKIKLDSKKPNIPKTKARKKKVKLPLKPIEKLKVSVQTGDIIPVVTPGNENKVAFVLENPNETPIELEVKLDIEDYYRNQRSITKKINLEPNEKTEIKPLYDGKTFGVYVINYQLKDLKTQDIRKDITSFCYMKPSGPGTFQRPGFMFSVNGGADDSKNIEDLKRVSRAISVAGIKVMRSSLVWEALQYKGPNTWREKKIEEYVNMLEILKKHGIEVQQLLAYNTQWNVPENILSTKNRHAWQFCPPNKKSMPDWLAFVEKELAAFSGYVRYWEVWNEADLYDFWRGSSAEYLELLEATYKTIKKHNPELQVMTSGFALVGEHGGHREENFERKVAVKGRPFYDILAHHQHGRTDMFYKGVDGELASIRKQINPPAPLWFNETATNTKKDNYRLQAASLTRKLLFGWSRGAMGYTWYQMRTGDLSLKSRRRWGLMSQKLEPKYVYAAYNTLIGLLDDKDFASQLKRGQDRYGFLFKPKQNTGEYVVGLWDEKEKLNDEPMAFAVGKEAKVFQVDLMGNQIPIPVWEGTALIKTELYTRFLLVKNAKQAPKALKPLIEIASPLPTAQPGKPYELPVKLNNPGNADLVLELNWQNLPGQQQIAPMNITIPANGTVEKTFTLNIPQDFKLPYGDLQIMKLNYKTPTASWQGTMKVPLEPTLLIPQTAMDSRQPDVVLEKYRYVTNRHENAPQRNHLTWQGIDDLSARIWLQADGKNLNIRADVKDNYNNANIDNLGDGDSLGLVLSVPGQEKPFAHLFANSNGKNIVQAVRCPKNKKPENIQLNTEPITGGLRYKVSIPYADLGLTQEILAKGIRMNIYAVDRDEEALEGWIQVAPVKHHWAPNWDPEMFSTFIFEGNQPK